MHGHSIAGVDAERLRLLTLATERELHAPLQALRLLLEGRRGTSSSLTERAFVDRDFVDRALLELLRAERAACDLVRWTAPRNLCVVPCTVSEVASSLESTLEPHERERCDIVVENGATELRTDSRLLVECLARTVEDALSRSATRRPEVLVHLHADDEDVTLSLVEGSAAGLTAFDPDEEEANEELTLAEAILERDVARLGGRVSLHGSSGHRCCVAVVPRRADALGGVPSVEERAQRSLGGAA
ncbi:MAG: hypothetical protein AAF726_07830 [Planctomycetota bacterium]